jgi:hypothetical protein
LAARHLSAHANDAQHAHTAAQEIHASQQRASAGETTMKNETIIDMLKAAGFQVYMRKPNDEYCYCTDGTGIAYVQWSNIRTSVGTVHVPNRQTGTGFQMFDDITPNHVRTAMDTSAPAWASSADRQSVRKYKDWDSFHNADRNKGLVRA